MLPLVEEEDARRASSDHSLSGCAPTMGPAMAEAWPATPPSKVQPNTRRGVLGKKGWRGGSGSRAFMRGFFSFRGYSPCFFGEKRDKQGSNHGYLVRAWGLEAEATRLLVFLSESRGICKRTDTPL